MGCVNTCVARNFNRRIILIFICCGTFFFSFVFQRKCVTRGKGKNSFFRVNTTLCLMFWRFSSVSSGCQRNSSRGRYCRVGRLPFKECKSNIYRYFIRRTNIINNEYRDSNIFFALLRRRRMGTNFSFLLTQSTSRLTFLSQDVNSTSNMFTYLAFRVHLNSNRASLCTISNNRRVTTRNTSTNVRVSCRQIIFLEKARRTLTFRRRLIMTISRLNGANVYRTRVSQGCFMNVVQVINVTNRRLCRPRLNTIFNAFLFMFQIFARYRLNITFRINGPNVTLRNFRFLFHNSRFTISSFSAFVGGFHNLNDRFIFIVINVPIMSFRRLISRVRTTLHVHTLSESLYSDNKFKDELCTRYSPMNIYRATKKEGHDRSFLHTLSNYKIFENGTRHTQQNNRRNKRLIRLLIMFLFSCPRFRVRLITQLRNRIGAHKNKRFLNFFKNGPCFREKAFMGFSIVRATLYNVTSMGVRLFRRFFSGHT